MASTVTAATRTAPAAPASRATLHVTSPARSAQHERRRAQGGDDDFLPASSGGDALDEEERHERREQQPVALVEHAFMPVHAVQLLVRVRPVVVHTG